MRHYPPDSPEAAARVLALALLADGAIDPSELGTLRRHAILDRLGLDEERFERVVHALCEDLAQYALRDASGQFEIGHEALREILGEVRHRRLQKRLLRTVHEIVEADGQLAGGEAVLVALAAECWGLTPFAALRIAPPPGRRWPPQLRRAAARRNDNAHHRPTHH